MVFPNKTKLIKVITMFIKSNSIKNNAVLQKTLNTEFYQQNSLSIYFFESEFSLTNPRPFFE